MRLNSTQEQVKAYHRQYVFCHIKILHNLLIFIDILLGLCVSDTVRAIKKYGVDEGI